MSVRECRRACARRIHPIQTAHINIASLGFFSLISFQSPIRGEIHLAHFTLVPLNGPKDLPYTFKIDCPNREHILRADDSNKYHEWWNVLQDLQQLNDKRGQDELTAIQQQTKSSNMLQSATRCAKCQTNFGILKSKIICVECGFAYCGSLTCIEAKSIHTNLGRSCVNCVERRQQAESGMVVSKFNPDMPMIGIGNNKKTSAVFGGPKMKPSNSNLLIKIISGKSLMACDSNNLSDPYCCIFFDGQEYRTDVIWKTLNPVWNQQFNIPITGVSKDIQIGVYDSDKYSNDDFMGQAEARQHHRVR